MKSKRKRRYKNKRIKGGKLGGKGILRVENICVHVLLFSISYIHILYFSLFLYSLFKLEPASNKVEPSDHWLRMAKAKNEVKGSRLDVLHRKEGNVKRSHVTSRLIYSERSKTTHT